MVTRQQGPGVRGQGAGEAKRHLSARRGVALIFVLLMMTLLGLAVSELVAKARAESRSVMTLKSRAIAQYAAESGVLATTVALRALLDSASEPSEIAAATRRLDTLGRVASRLMTGDAQCGVAVLDLNARLDLVHGDTTALRALFAEFTSSERAGAVVRNLQTEPVTRFSELARVPGADDALALAVAPYITVGSDGFVNANSAPEAVLAALPGVGPGRAHAIIAQREREPLTSIDGFRAAPGSHETVPVGGLRLTVAPTRLMIVSRGWQRGSPVTHEIQAVYALTAGRLRLVSWEERER